MKYLALLVMSLFILLSACGQLSGDVLTYRTADPAVSIAFELLPPAPPLPTITPQVVPCIEVKANISTSGERIYHMPGQANYNTVKIDKDGEAIYCTEQDAIDAGFRKAQR